MQCVANAHSTGQRCGKGAITGGTVCYTHGGAAPQVKAQAAVRAEVMRWVPGTAIRDPGEVLLQLLTQSIMRAERYAEEIEKALDEDPDLRTVLIGDAYGEHGTKVGEYIRGLAVLEAQERDRAANFATKALSAGIAERSVRLAERQGELLANIFRAVIDNPQLGLSAAQRAAFPVVVREQMTIAAGLGKKR